MIFIIFRDFSRFFRFYFLFKTFKIIKKMIKCFYFSRGSHVDATSHSGSRGSTTRAHTAPTRRIIIFIIHIVHSLYKWVFSFPYIGNVFKPTNPSGIINLTSFINIFRVGLSPTQLSSFQATWLTEERRSSGAQKIHASIA